MIQRWRQEGKWEKPLCTPSQILARSPCNRYEVAVFVAWSWQTPQAAG